MIRLLGALAVTLLLSGCGGPTLIFPGGALSGEQVATPVSDWSFADDAFVDLEVRPSDPYSVELNYVVQEGQLYIDPAEGRRWLDYLREDSRVRVRFGDRVYAGEAVLVGEPGGSLVIEGLGRDRFLYRIDARAAD